MTFITRFAPSPTGPLHLGHAFSALVAHDMAQSAGGTFLLRIDDLDTTRARPEWESRIYEDLHWLGLGWPEPVLRQSDHLARYAAAIDALGAGACHVLPRLAGAALQHIAGRQAFVARPGVGERGGLEPVEAAR